MPQGQSRMLSRNFPTLRSAAIFFLIGKPGKLRDPTREPSRVAASAAKKKRDGAVAIPLVASAQGASAAGVDRHLDAAVLLAALGIVGAVGGLVGRDRLAPAPAPA